MKRAITFLTALLPLLAPAPACAGPRDTNHVVNPGFENNADGKAKGWSRYGEGYELVRQGLEDDEYLWALGQKRGDPWSARKDCEPVTTSLTAFTRDPAVLLATRERVARELSEGGRHKP